MLCGGGDRLLHVLKNPKPPVTEEPGEAWHWKESSPGTSPGLWVSPTLKRPFKGRNLIVRAGWSAAIWKLHAPDGVCIMRLDAATK